MLFGDFSSVKTVMHFSFGRVLILNLPVSFWKFFSMTCSSVSAMFLPHSTHEIGMSSGSHDCLSNEGFELVGLVNDISISDSSGSLSAVEDSRSV